MDQFVYTQESGSLAICQWNKRVQVRKSDQVDNEIPRKSNQVYRIYLEEGTTIYARSKRMYASMISK